MPQARVSQQCAMNTIRRGMPGPPGKLPGGHHALKWATIEKARSMGSDHSVRSLEPDKEADIVMIDPGGVKVHRSGTSLAVKRGRGRLGPDPQAPRLKPDHPIGTGHSDRLFNQGDSHLIPKMCPRIRLPTGAAFRVATLAI